jgi:PEP-CTERM motif
MFPDTNGQTYSQDEIEGNERLRLTFASGVQLLSFNVTDFFYENEKLQTGLPLCVAPGQIDCYQEWGEYSIDGGLTWVGFLASQSQMRGTAGALTIPVNQFTTSLILRAPGAINVSGFSYPQLLDYSLAGIEIDQTPIPEPSSMLLLGSALGGWTVRRWRQGRAARSRAPLSRGNVTSTQ